MKVLHIAPSLHPVIGGPRRSIMGICQGLAREGVETTLFVHCRDVAAPDLDGVRVVFGMGTGMGNVWRDIKREINRSTPDIIHLHAFWMVANHLAFLIANHHSIPVVLSIRGSLNPWALRQKWLKKQLALRLYLRGDLRRAACLHATAEQEAEHIRAQQVSSPIVVMPNGVDLPEKMPTRMSIDSPFKTALFLSRLHPGKGLLDLVRAWARVRPQGWRMRIVGPDVCGHKAAVLAEIERQQLQNDFTFIGELDDKAKWQEYVNADLFVHPSHSENFGISIAEALAAGVPVITTKGTPWQELQGGPASSEVLKCESALVEGTGDGGQSAVAVGSGSRQLGEHCSDHARMNERTNGLAANGRCGWWIDIGADALAEALQEAMQLSDVERRQFGVNGRNLIAAKYTWATIACQMKCAYEQVLRQNRI